MVHDLKKLTKPQLLEVIDKQSAEIAALRAELSAARATRDVRSLSGDPKYPFLDKLGKRYRVENHGGKQVRCFAP